MKTGSDQSDWIINHQDERHLILASFSTYLLQVHLGRADTVDELGGVCSAAVALDQQVLVEVADPAAGLQLGVGGRVRRGRWGLRRPPMAVHVHQLVQRAAVRALSDWRKVMSAGLLLPGHGTDGHRWRT